MLIKYNLVLFLRFSNPISLFALLSKISSSNQNILTYIWIYLNLKDYIIFCKIILYLKLCRVYWKQLYRRIS